MKENHLGTSKFFSLANIWELPLDRGNDVNIKPGIDLLALWHWL